MHREPDKNRGGVLPGTLDMLVLRTLSDGPLHGYRIAKQIQQMSNDVLQIEEGSLYPSLQRMLMKGWLTAEWRQSERNRRARYYRLTPLGRKQLAAEISEFTRIMGAIVQVIQPA